MNDYYTSPADIAAATKARSVDINTIDASVDAAFDKMPKLAALFTGNASFVVDTGGQNALSFQVPVAVKALEDGMRFRVRLANSITGAAVATAGALGTFPVRRPDGSALAGELLAGQVAALTYLGGVFYANVAGQNPIAANGLPITGGTMTGALNGAKGAAIASVAALDLQGATGNLVHVTGTTTVTNIILAPGASREVVFDGVLTLTHSAALSLPGKANIITQAGDRATFYGDSIGNVIVTKYQRIDGNPLAVQHGLVPIGGMIAFDQDVQGNIFITGTGETYLKTGVIADASAYAGAPAGPWASINGGLPNLTPTDTICSLAAGNGVYVASMRNGNVMLSKDGYDWAQIVVRNFSAGSSYSYVAFANGYFILATNGFVYRSTDGIAWTVVLAGAAGVPWGVGYGNGRWVLMIGGTTTFYTSDDNGTTWTTRALATALAAPTGGFSNGVIYGGGQFVGFNYGTSSYVTSPDGITWTVRSAPNGIYGMAYGNGIFVFTYYAANQPPFWFSSPNAIAWTSRGQGTGISSSPGVIFQFGRFSISDGGNASYWSNDGITWSSTVYGSATVTQAYGGVQSLDGTFTLAYSSQSFMRLASNGINWMAATYGLGGGSNNMGTLSVTMYEFTWCNDRFMMSSTYSGNAFYFDVSFDGKSWWRAPIPQSGATAGLVLAVAYFNGKYHCITSGGTNNYFTSVDGYNWTAVGAGNTPGVAPSGAGLTSVNGKLFSMARSTSFSVTSDGITWTTASIVTGLNRVTFGNGVYLAWHNQTQSYATSADGVAWTTQAYSFKSNVIGVVFASGFFVTATASGQIYKSADGITWAQMTNFVYGAAPTAFTSLDTDGTTVVFQSNTDASITLWNGAASDPLYRRGATIAMKSLNGIIGVRCSPAGLFSAKDGLSPNSSYGQISAVPKVLNDYNIKTYDAANIARGDFYKRVA